MISAPKPGQLVQVHYNKKAAPFMPYHGKIGPVRIVSKARVARNHGVELDGKVIAIPRGNLREPK